MSNIGPNLNQPGRQPMPSPQAPAQTSAQSSPEAGAPTSNTVTPGLPGGAPSGEMNSQFPLAALFATQQAMSTSELLLLLRNLLRMPKELVQLMALLANLEQGSVEEMLKKLLTEDAPVPLEELQQLLVTHADKCQEKLLKLMQSSGMEWSGSGRSMGDLMNLLSQVTSQARRSPTEALQSTLALYLPYYPLQGPQRFSLQFEPLEDDEEGGGGEQQQLVIYIDTLSLGKFRISLAARQRQTQLQILIAHDPLPAALLQEIEKQVQTALNMENVPPADLIFKENPGATARQQATSGQTTPEEETEKPAVAIHPSGGVSAVSIQAAYVLIRVILDIDTRQSLLDQRAEIAENPESPHE
ncbi:MAG TPA: hypothetical protein V6C52_06215 [Coleofasciculaceae cyanobacterium]|jgi:hypothetical protein